MRPFGLSETDKPGLVRFEGFTHGLGRLAPGEPQAAIVGNNIDFLERYLAEPERGCISGLARAKAPCATKGTGANPGIEAGDSRARFSEGTCEIGRPGEGREGQGRAHYSLIVD